MATTESVEITRLAEERLNAAGKKALARARRRRMTEPSYATRQEDAADYKAYVKSECRYAYQVLGRANAMAFDVFGQIKRGFPRNEEGRVAKDSKPKSAERIALRREARLAMLELEEERREVDDFLMRFDLLDDDEWMDDYCHNCGSSHSLKLRCREDELFPPELDYPD